MTMQTFSNSQDAAVNLSQRADAGGGQVSPMSIQMGAHQVNILGLTKRELFAVQLMAARRSNPHYDRVSRETLAEMAVAEADVLLKELAK
jgi:hypothetical protein